MNYKFTNDWTHTKFIESNLPTDNINTRCLEKDLNITLKNVIT